MNTKFKILKAKHYILLVIVLIMIVTLLVKLYPECFGDLIEFPFVANVWGTFSDVMIFIVTSFTLYFLYHNLKAQGQTLELQRQALEEQKSEKEIYKLQIQPDIIISECRQIRDTPSIPNSPLINRVFQIKFKITNAGMRNCRLLDFNDSKYSIMPQLQFDTPKHYTIGHEFVLNVTFHDIDPRPMHYHSPEKLILEFHFSDTLGNPYSKKIILKKTAENHLEPPISIPTS